MALKNGVDGVSGALPVGIFVVTRLNCFPPLRGWPFATYLYRNRQPSTTLGVITPTAGARSRAIRVSCLGRPGVRMSLFPHSHGEGAGAASFLGLRGIASGTYAARVGETEFSVTVARHMEEI